MDRFVVIHIYAVSDNPANPLYYLLKTIALLQSFLILTLYFNLFQLCATSRQLIYFILVMYRTGCN